MRIHYTNDVLAEYCLFYCHIYVKGYLGVSFFCLNTNVKKHFRKKHSFLTMFNVNLCHFCDILLEINQKSLEFKSKV